MLILNKAAIANALCIFGLVQSLATHAQVPVVNCGMFRNAGDQARCVAQNQEALRIYQHNQQLRNAYYAAQLADKAAGYAAGKMVPGGGGTLTYQAGKQLGNYMYQNPQPGHAYSPPPIPQPQYVPPQLPNQLRPYAPSYPNYGSPRQR